MEKKRIDLHMHSRYSDDGEYSPADLVRMCKEQGIQVMAIADHNSVRANEEAQEAAGAAGITYIPSIEIDCVFRGVNLHVLGYGIDSRSEDFQWIENNIDSQSMRASYQMLRATQEMGFQITEGDMEKLEESYYWKGRWTGEMFAEVLLGKPEYEDHPILKNYREGGSRSDNPFVNFYWDFYSQGKPCYVKMEYPSLEKTVEMIHRSNGKAVLAHPGVNLKNREDLLLPVIQAGIDGIEAFSSYHSPDQCSCFYDEARRCGLFATCESDFHGKTKPAIHLGSTGCREEENEILDGLKKSGLITG